MSMTMKVTSADPVAKIMVEDLVEVDPGESLRSVAQQLVGAEIGVVLVKTPGGPVGLISERDLVNVLVGGGDFDTQQAADIATTDLITAQPGDSIASVGQLMLDAWIRHIAVREGNTVVGIVSIRDVLAVLLTSAQTS
jgi:CBS domain-containing protein